VVAPLFASLDQSFSPPKPQIYFYDPLGAQFQSVTHVASGSGSGTIRSILSFQEQYGTPRPSQMNLAEAVKFTLRLLMVASESIPRPAASIPRRTPYATIRVLRSSGVEAVSDEQQAEIFRR